MTIGITVTLTRQTFVGKVMSLFFFLFLAAQLAGYQFLNQGLNLVEGVEDMR